MIGGQFRALFTCSKWAADGSNCPADYSLSPTIYNRFNRWSQQGFWGQLLTALIDAGVARGIAINNTQRPNTPHFAQKEALGASDRAISARLDHEDPRAYRGYLPSCASAIASPLPPPAPFRNAGREDAISGLKRL